MIILHVLVCYFVRFIETTCRDALKQLFPTHEILSLQWLPAAIILQVKTNTRIAVRGSFPLLFDTLRLKVLTLASVDDECVNNLLREYHQKNITNRVTISKLLGTEGITMRFVVILGILHAF